MNTKERLTLYVYQAYLKSMLTLSALVRLDPIQAKRVLAREEGQGVLEYVALLSGVAIVLVVIFAIFISIRTRAENTQATIDSLPMP